MERECKRQILDRAAAFYQKSNFVAITFTVSKCPSETLGQFIHRLRLEKGLEQKELAQRIGVSEEIGIIGKTSGRTCV